LRVYPAQALDGAAKLFSYLEVFFGQDRRCSGCCPAVESKLHPQCEKIFLSLFQVAMATQLLQFGDKSTADTKLQLIGIDGTEYETNTLYLHSQVLRKSEFYEIMLSDTWSPGKQPIEIKITSPHYAEMHIKCIRLMYSSQKCNRFCFSSVDEALAILPVASELMFHDCMDACMRYLDTVKWTREQEAKLRALLSSLQIKPLPDLAARLGTYKCDSDCEHLKMLEEALEGMLSIILDIPKSRLSINIYNTVEKYIEQNMETNASLGIADVCRSVLLNKCSDVIKRLKSNDDDVEYFCAVFLWFVDLIHRCDEELCGKVMRLFCEDVDVMKRVRQYKRKCIVEQLLFILVDRFLKYLVDGKIIMPASFRISFLTNWVPVMVKLICTLPSTSPLASSLSEKIIIQELLERGMMDVAGTLPLVEQKRIYNIWVEEYQRNELDTSRAFGWWTKKLHDAHHPLEDFGDKEQHSH